MEISDELIEKVVSEAHIVTPTELDAIKAFAKSAGPTLSDSLIQKNITTDQQLGRLIAIHLNVPFVNLAEVTIPDTVYRIVPDKFAKTHHLIPFPRDTAGIHAAIS